MPSFDDLNPGPVTASLVVSNDGQTISEMGSSKGLGNETDLQLLKWFRARSQIVLTSGKTAFAEEYRYPSSAELAILSRSERNYTSLRKTSGELGFLPIRQAMSLPSKLCTRKALKESTLNSVSKALSNWSSLGLPMALSAQFRLLA